MPTSLTAELAAASAVVERLKDSLGAQLVETHISWVLLAPELAYKLKKPVHLPFVDYSTAAKRRQFCEAEVRLNRRLAPSIYLGVSRVTGPPEAPAFDGSGATLDYAVRMRRFAPGALFSERLEAGSLEPESVDRLATYLARFHASAAPAAPSMGLASEDVYKRVLGALEGARPALSAQDHGLLRDWLAAEWPGVEAFWQRRLANGAVREGHGDLHLSNIVDLDGEIAAFDCIEFDPALRSIDVLEDAAFAFMDFGARGRADLAWRFINGWLEATGDYEALPALRFYTVGRALVRTLVEHLRQPGGPLALRYANAAVGWCRPTVPMLTITHGLPGSGKTFQSQQLLEREGAIRIRSDVERKRLFGLQPLENSRAKGLDLYTAAVTHRTYGRLFALTRPALAAGLSVVLDAAFLRHGEREEAREVARAARAGFSILACEAPPLVLRERLQARRGDASEADTQVLANLSAAAEPLRADELADRRAAFG